MSEMELTRHAQVRKQAQPHEDVSAGPARPFSDFKEALREFDAEVSEAPKGISNQRESLPPVPDHPQLIGTLMKNATILSANGEHRLSENILRNVLVRAPNHPEALKQMGICLRETMRHEDALKCFRALAKIRFDADAAVLVADALYLLERDEEALQGYFEALRLGVEESARLFEIYKNLGNIYVRAGDFDAAEEYYDKAYTLNHQSDVLLVNYGTLEIQRERFDEAVERFRQAIELNTNNDRAWVGLAMVHRQKGDFELARANIERAMDVNRGNRTALRLVIDWGVQDGAWSAVIARLQDYLGQNGEDAEMSFTLAKVFTHVGRLREARLEVERVLALDPLIEGGEPLKIALDREIARMERGAGAN